jgi:predicted nuclease of predicted toxin-antitoxin system
MRFLVDMNVSPAWVELLNEAGFDAVHWSQIGPGDATDRKVMRWAADHDHIVLTSDLDFGAILAASRARQPSVLQLRCDLLTPEAIGPRVLAAIAEARQELNEGALVSIDASRARLRILPLGE